MAPGDRGKAGDVQLPARARPPGQRDGGAGPVLAGDYTASDYPATLEAAVRSGMAAAGLVSVELG